MVILRGSASFPRWLEPVEEMWHIPNHSGSSRLTFASYSWFSMATPSRMFFFGEYDNFLPSCVYIYIYIYINLSLKKDNPSNEKNTNLSLYASGLFFSLYRVYPKFRWYHWAAFRLWKSGHKNSTTGPPHMEASVWDLLMLDLASWTVWIHGKVGQTTGVHGGYTLWLCQQFAIENGHRMVFFHSYVAVYQSVTAFHKFSWIWLKKPTYN